MSTSLEVDSLEKGQNPEFLVRGAVASLVDQFLKIDIGGRKFRCPFWMNNDYIYKGTELYRSVPKGGKLTPLEVRERTIEAAQKHGVDLIKADEDQVKLLMLIEGIGVDCSGFVYQCQRAAYETLGGLDFDNKISSARTGQNGITKIGITDLIDPRYSIAIERLEDIRAGDFIFFLIHTAQIIKRDGDLIHCAHASNEIWTPGVHTFDIQVIRPDGGIFDQVWLETDMSGANYNDAKISRVKPGNGVRRLKIIDELYTTYKSISGMSLEFIMEV